MIKSLYFVIEGRIVVLECNVIDVNLNINIIWKWFRLSSNISFFYNGFIYIIFDIMRNKVGLYNCMVINFVGMFLLILIYVNV